MDFDQLQRFLAVIDRGSLGEAARELNVSQPTLSKSIKRLEASVGTPLFDRTNDGMVPNRYGTILVHRARTLSLGTARASAEIREMLDGARGRVHICIAPSFSATVLPTALARFRQVHPRVEIDAIEDTVDQAADRIRAGEIDFAVGTVSPAFMYEGLTVEPLFREGVVVAASASHPLATRRRLTPHDLWAWPWMVAKVFRTKLYDAFLDAGLQMPENVIYFVSTSFGKNIVLSSNYLVMISHSSIETEVRAGTLSVLSAPQFQWERTVGLVYREGLRLLPAAEKLMGLIRETSAAYHTRKRAPRKLAR